MYNQLVEKNGAWTYSPIKYWPNNSKDSIRFFAYAPHSTKAAHNCITLSAINTTGYPSITYTIPSDVKQHKDFMVAKTECLSKGGAVNLSFKHALTKIGFSVSGYTTKVIKKITIKDIKNKGICNLGTFAWSNLEGSDSFTVSTDSSTLIPHTPTATPTKITTDDGYLFMIPQYVSGKTIIFEFREGEPINISIPSNTIWNAGGNYLYNLHIDKDKTILTISSIWEEEDNIHEIGLVDLPQDDLLVHYEFSGLSNSYISPTEIKNLAQNGLAPEIKTKDGGTITKPANYATFKNIRLNTKALINKNSLDTFSIVYVGKSPTYGKIWYGANRDGAYDKARYYLYATRQDVLHYGHGNQSDKEIKVPYNSDDAFVVVDINQKVAGQRFIKLNAQDAVNISSISNFNLNGLLVGCQNFDESNGFDNTEYDLYLFLVYNRALTDEEIKKIYEYIKQKSFLN